MNSEEKFPSVNPIQGNQVQVGNVPTTNAYPGMENRTQMNDPRYNILPLDVTKELAQYQRIFVTKEFDYFKIVHRCEDYLHDYKVFGELPDGDKKLLFMLVDILNVNAVGIIVSFLYVCVLMSVAILLYFN